MQGSTRDSEPLVESPRANTACPRVELILKNINRLDLLTRFQAGPGFVWDDTLIPYSKDHLPKDKHGCLDYRTRFLGEQNNHLSDASPLSPSIQGISKLADRSSPRHLQVIDICELFNFNFDRPLGHGSFGEVFKAKSKAIESPEVKVFAIKRFRKPAPGEATRNTVTSFKSELEKLEKLENNKHRHMISFHASFTDEKYFGFITSPVAESNLKYLLEKFNPENPSPSADREIFYESFGCLLEAVRHLHHLEMRHCDLKPSNILVVRDPSGHRYVRICDLGSAYTWDSQDQNESTDKNRRGTQKYKAPEVLRDKVLYGKKITHDRKVDIFSLGCILLELHTRLEGRTLDQMARAITLNQKSSFNGLWTYADSLQGIGEWLKELHPDDDDGHGEVPVRLIKSMLCEDRNERKAANHLFEEIRSHHKYIGDCCRPRPEVSTSEEIQSIQSDDNLQSESSEPELGKMEYETPRPFETCRIMSRERGFESPKYSEYKALEDFGQGGKVEIQKDGGGTAWTMTRRIKVTTLQSPRVNIEQWLPAYYVQSTRINRQVTFEWSDCNQINQNRTQHDRHRSPVFEKVHHSNPSRNNLRMQIIFEKESDAKDFCALLLEEPIERSALFEVHTPNQKSFFVRQFDWKCLEKDSVANGSKGSLVICSQHSLQSTQSSRLESFFVPYNFDFTLPLLNDQRYTKLISKYLWVPAYRSNVNGRYEEPKEKGVFEKVELVRLRNDYTFNFEKKSEDTFKPNSRHVEVQLPNSWNDDLQQFLKSLTGWNLLVVFSATKVQQKKSWGSSGKWSADVLCFQKSIQKRIAIRRKNAPDESTTKWMTATLENSHDTKNGTLLMELKSRQKGGKLALTTVTATEGDAGKSTNKSENWVFTIKSGAREIDYILNSRTSYRP